MWPIAAARGQPRRARAAAAVRSRSRRSQPGAQAAQVRGSRGRARRRAPISALPIIAALAPDIGAGIDAVAGAAVEDDRRACAAKSACSMAMVRARPGERRLWRLVIGDLEEMAGAGALDQQAHRDRRCRRAAALSSCRRIDGGETRRPVPEIGGVGRDAGDGGAGLALPARRLQRQELLAARRAPPSPRSRRKDSAPCLRDAAELLHPLLVAAGRARGADSVSALSPGCGSIIGRCQRSTGRQRLPVAAAGLARARRSSRPSSGSSGRASVAGRSPAASRWRSIAWTTVVGEVAVEHGHGRDLVERQQRGDEHWAQSRCASRAAARRPRCPASRSEPSASL